MARCWRVIQKYHGEEVECLSAALVVVCMENTGPCGYADLLKLPGTTAVNLLSSKTHGMHFRLLRHSFTPRTRKSIIPIEAVPLCHSQY